MINVANVSKYFGLKPILKDISFEIKPGEIVGFLGPNGAGKTTLMRLLTSFLSPSSGSVSIDGYDTLKNSLLTRQKIGYLPETPPLYPDMTVIDYLRFAARLKGLENRVLATKIKKTLEECDIASVQHQTIATLSKGYKQRVGIAQAIVHDPEVLILDEPTNGLDPLQILQVRRLIKNLEQKKTVIVSTHILPEIEQIAKRVIILNKGQIVADQNLDDLLSNPEQKEKRFELEEVFLRLTSNPTP